MVTRASAVPGYPSPSSGGQNTETTMQPGGLNAMKAYAIDLRQKVLVAYQHSEGSIRQLAKRFTVSPRFVGALVWRFRRTGTYAPKPHGGGHPSRIDAEGQKIVCECVQQHPDATLDELCHLYAERCQVMPSRSSMHRTLALLKLTRKKRLITLQSVTAMMSKHSVTSINKR
jgi:transposase